jgi:putative hydrolase of the HAD superfamily
MKLVSEKKLTDYFINSYFSHEIGRRKPHSETFTFVCEDAKIDPIRTLFIDDSEQHLVGAEKIGLKTFHYKEKEDFFNLFIH